MNKWHLFLLSLLSGLLLALAWPRDGFPGLALVGFIPLLFLEDHISKNRKDFHRFAVLVYSYPGFLLWNGLTTWWIWNSTEIGAALALIANSFFMAVVFNLYSYTKRFVYGKGHGYFILPLFWMSFEYWHFNWDMSWPWLTIGNVFASFPEWVQWYEYTGVFGGTLWVLVMNVLFYRFIILGRNKPVINKQSLTYGVISLVLLIGPLWFSFHLYNNYEERTKPVEVIISQANLDPYTEQYELPPLEVIEMNLDPVKEYIDDETDFVVCPESSIQESIWEHRYEASPSLRYINSFIRDFPQLAVVIGASTFKEYFDDETPSYTARKFKDADAYYDAYNTVFYLDSTGEYRTYHKSKLTPAVEKMPFPKYLKFLEHLSIDLGGTVGSLGTDDVRKVFIRPSDSLEVAAIICYESVYGEFFSRFVRNGAELVFIVTNDGWWGNTAGHRQHFSYARLRAVETRRSIARSANTGISAFIDQRGNILEESPYWEPAVLKGKINANDRMTYYVLHGDYLARIAAFVSVLLLLIAISLALRKPDRLSGRS